MCPFDAFLDASGKSLSSNSDASFMTGLLLAVSPSASAPLRLSASTWRRDVGFSPRKRAVRPTRDAESWCVSGNTNRSESLLDKLLHRLPCRSSPLGGGALFESRHLTVPAPCMPIPRYTLTSRLCPTRPHSLDYVVWLTCVLLPRLRSTVKCQRQAGQAGQLGGDWTAWLQLSPPGGSSD